MALSETTSKPELASMTMDALVKEHNVLVGLAAENLQLRQELTNMREYAVRLEGLIEELKALIPEEPDGHQEAESVRQAEGQMPEVRQVTTP